MFFETTIILKVIWLEIKTQGCSQKVYFLTIMLYLISIVAYPICLKFLQFVFIFIISLSYLGFLIL